MSKRTYNTTHLFYEKQAHLVRKLHSYTVRKSLILFLGKYQVKIMYKSNFGIIFFIIKAKNTSKVLAISSIFSKSKYYLRTAMRVGRLKGQKKPKALTDSFDLVFELNNNH